MSIKISNTNSLIKAKTLNWVVDAAIKGDKNAALAKLEGCVLNYGLMEKIRTILNTFQSNGDSKEFQSLKYEIVQVLNNIEPANLDFICADTIYELSLQCLSTGGITSALTLACTCQTLNQSIIPCLQKLKDEALLAMWKGNWMIRERTWPVHLGIEGKEAIDVFYEDGNAVDGARARITNAKVEDVRVHLRNPFEVERFKAFSNMSCLFLIGSEMKIIPSEITLMNLNHIDIRQGQIRFIPEFLCNFKKLKSLDLTNNQISNIPAYIIDKVCDKMMLQLEGNPLLFIPEKHRKEGLCPDTCSGIGYYMLCFWFSKFNNYDDSSKFSKFIKLCLSDIVDKEKIKSEFDLFRKDTKENIMTVIDIEINSCKTSEYDQWPQRQYMIFDGLTIDNADLFCKALRNVLDKI